MFQNVLGWTYGLDFDHLQSTSGYHRAQPLSLALLLRCLRWEGGIDVPTMTSSSLLLNHFLTCFALSPAFSWAKMPFLLA